MANSELTINDQTTTTLSEIKTEWRV